jgi:phosphohistidine phosphatase
MKTLILLRHAKSDWSDTTLRDFDRALNRRGVRAATIMGEWARRQGLTFDALIASPAVRVVETLTHFAEAHGGCPQPIWDRRLYLASSATIQDVIHEAPATAQTLLLVGHNPGLEDLILDLVPADGLSVARDAVEEKLPTAAVAVLRFDAEQWTDVAPGAILERFVRPRDLDSSLGPES